MATDHLVASPEAKPAQIRLAELQGRALRAAIDEMTLREAHWGALREAGDYLVGCAVEEAEGMWVPDGDRLSWKLPATENAHVEIVVCDARDERFIPGLDVTATLIARDGTDLGTHRQPFLWHPWLLHYGRNWTVPSDGRYTVHVTIEPASFARHDSRNGNRFGQRVEVVFKDVEIRRGQKRSQPDAGGG